MVIDNLYVHVCHFILGEFFIEYNCFFGAMRENGTEVVHTCEGGMQGSPGLAELESGLVRLVCLALLVSELRHLGYGVEAKIVPRQL